MEKLKDFVYEHSDLFFTVLIVAVVGVIVTSNLYGWFDIKDDENKYKEINEIIHEEQDSTESDKTNTDSKQTNTKEPDKEVAKEPVKEPAKASDKEPVKETTKEPAKEAVIRNVDIAPGSSSASIAKALEKQGLISSSSDFLSVLSASGKETKLKAGTFSIPEGSSSDKIIEILTK